MKLRNLKIFIAVCECGSTVEAAKEIEIAQPTISLAIKELESHYQIKLFNRISRHLFLTDAGKQFLTHAKEIIDDLDTLESTMVGYESLKQLNVGASMTIASTLLPIILKDFKKIHPDTQLNVEIRDSNTLASMVQDLTLDLALIEAPVHLPYLATKLFCNDKLVFCCSSENVLAKRKDVSLYDITRESLLLREKGSASRVLIDSLFKSKGYEATPTIESVSFDSLIPLTESNLGISILPFTLLPKQKNIVILPVKEIEIIRSYSIIYHKNKNRGTLEDDFISLCEKIGSKFI